MLSDREIEKIKLGIKMIRKQVPEATLEQTIKTFYHVFGCNLPEEDMKTAEQIIVREFDSTFMD